jgi:hypothetical protein
MEDPVEAKPGAEHENVIRDDRECAGKLAELQRFVSEGMAGGISMRTMDQILLEARIRSDLADRDEIQNGPRRCGIFSPD